MSDCDCKKGKLPPVRAIEVEGDSGGAHARREEARVVVRAPGCPEHDLSEADARALLRALAAVLT